jgi:Na+:H+ antiporter, NhaA family
MSDLARGNWLDRPVDEKSDHVLSNPRMRRSRWSNMGVELARRAAELVERAHDPKRFWDAHVKLMTRSETLTEDDVRAVANDLGASPFDRSPDDPAVLSAKARVDADERSSGGAGAIPPAYF